MPGRFAFLPNLRTRLATDAAAAGARLKLAYNVTITGDGAEKAPAIPIQAELRGPGDVIGVDTAQIVRVEPEAGLRAFEPTYFPFVEFRDADFPWRYSLDPGEGSRKTPWLTLIALEPTEFEFVDGGSAPLPRIRVASIAASLPDLAQSWAFAHVQVNVPDEGAVDVAKAVSADAAASFSRLLCCRRLQARATYFLFLVPTYKGGVLAGLGSRDVAAAGAALAWTAAATESIELPFYYQARFSTDAQEDVEQLLRRLRALTAAEASGAELTARASAAKPGYYLDYAKAGASFEIQGALKQPGTAPEPCRTDAALAARMKTTLEQVIRGEAPDGDEDPLVAFPPYGFRFRQYTSVDLARAQQDQWFDRVNLDLAMRHVAALGGETVRRNQELFMKLCWDQYAEIVEANLKLGRLRAASELAAKVSAKHLQNLPPAVVLSLAEPLQPHVSAKTGVAIIDALRGAGTSPMFASRALRRRASTRQVRTAAGDRKTREIPAPSLPGDTSAGITARPVLFRPSRQTGMLAESAAGATLTSTLTQLFGAEAFKNEKRPRGSAVRVGAIDARELVSAIGDVVRRLPGAKAEQLISGRTAAEKKTIAPVFRSPIVPLPLSDFLVDVSRTSLIPGISKLPENTVAAFEENRHFVEAFMVGANHAINDELRWRGFPTDMRGTVLRRFWNRAQPTSGTAGDDIKELHAWTGLLGRNAVPGNAEARLVVVIRGDIVRKLAQPIVVINEGAGARWESGKGTDYEPVFFGRIGRDVAYYGFNVARDYILSPAVKSRTFVVVYEPMGRLRFGLDVGTAAVRTARQNFGELALAFPVKAAGRTYQQVRARRAGTGMAAPARLADWSDLSWSHVSLTTSRYVRFDKTVAIADASKGDYWGAARTSASLARAMWQKPVAAVLPLARIL